MVSKFSAVIRSTARLVLVLVAFSLIGCGAYHSLPANWDRDLPGVYEGTASSFREWMEFLTNGTFRHQVFEADRLLIMETGKWSVVIGQFAVNLDRFGQFYNPMSRTFSNTVADFASYEFWPLPDGKTFSKISADVNFEFVLSRTGEPMR